MKGPKVLKDVVKGLSDVVFATGLCPRLVRGPLYSPPRLCSGASPPLEALDCLAAATHPDFSVPAQAPLWGVLSAAQELVPRIGC